MSIAEISLNREACGLPVLVLQSCRNCARCFASICHGQCHGHSCARSLTKGYSPLLGSYSTTVNFISSTLGGVNPFGSSRHQRDAVKAELQKLQKALRKKGAIAGKTMIIGARVPIIKCNLAILGNQIPADISLGVANGLSAVAFVEQQVGLYVLA